MHRCERASAVVCVFIASVLMPLLDVHGQSDLPAETPQQRDARMKWFRDARFGMFIHWGIYAVPAGEWDGRRDYGEWIMESAKIPSSRYERFATQFNPVKFDARQWVKLARDAGMKYIVITSKHHDGFSMFDSKLTEYDIMSTPFARDPMKELAEACREQGITFCFYHSIMDWDHPAYEPRRAWNDTAAGQPDMDRYVEYMKGQLRELLTNYGSIGIIWFDGNWEDTWTHERGRDLYAYVRSLQPSVIVNDRAGKSVGLHGDRARMVGDYVTPEQEVPATALGGADWETCMTMNDHWGYNRHDENYKSTRQLLHTLCDVASKGGNYLLNVGPAPDGTIPETSAARLREIGQWMRANGESIYSTRAGPFKKPPAWGRCTQVPGKLYLHVFDWPADGKLVVPATNRPARAYLLARPSELLATRSGADGVTIALPPAAPDPNVSVIVLEIDGAPQVIAPPPPAQAADGSVVLRAADADIVGERARIETIDGQPSIGYWTNAGDHVAWSFQLNTPGTFEVELTYACAPASAGSEFVVEVAGKTVNGKVPATKAWRDFTAMKLGTITLDKPGLLTLSVRPRTKPGEGVMNLRTIALRPVS